MHFSDIENYISDAYFDKLDFGKIKKNGIHVGVIGGGPAGITIAILLARKGYKITIFESREKIGGVLRYGIPELRLPKAILEKYKKLMLSLGIKIRPNTSIGATITIDDLFRDGYKAIFIGTGVWKPNTLHIKGESLGNAHFAINYLTNPDVYTLGPRDRIVSTTMGLDVTDRGLLVTNTYGNTTRDGIFAAGDVVRGARTVVEAVNYSKQVAEAMDEYLRGLPAEMD